MLTLESYKSCLEYFQNLNVTTDFNLLFLSVRLNIILLTNVIKDLLNQFNVLHVYYERELHRNNGS